MKNHFKKLAIGSYVCFGLISCVGANTSEPETLCGGGGQDFFHLQLSPPLGLGTYHLRVATESGVANCDATFSANPSDPLVCSGDFDLDLTQEHIWIQGAPSEIALRLERGDNSALLEKEYRPQYVDRDPESTEFCGPSLYAEATAEPEGMAEGQVD